MFAVIGQCTGLKLVYASKRTFNMLSPDALGAVRCVSRLAAGGSNGPLPADMTLARVRQ